MVLHDTLKCVSGGTGPDKAIVTVVDTMMLFSKEPTERVPVPDAQITVEHLKAIQQSVRDMLTWRLPYLQ